MSDEKKSSALIHIDAGDWSKPVNTLIEKCAEGIAAIARPMQIRREAKAQVEAEKIYAVGQVEIEEIQRRALARFVAEETKRQHNMESIITKALPSVNQSAKPENVEDDWIANFFDKCRLISDEQMQALWARILAEEANSPGKFSKRAVASLASMDKADANKFTKVCDFLCEVESEIAPVIFDYRYPIYAQHGLDYSLLSHLDTVGLIRFETAHRHYFSMDQLPQRTVVRYFGQDIVLDFSNSPADPLPSKYQLGIGLVLFTDAGQQLAKICEAKPVPGFLEYLKQAWITLLPKEGGAQSPSSGGSE